MRNTNKIVAMFLAFLMILTLPGMNTLANEVEKSVDETKVETENLSEDNLVNQGNEKIIENEAVIPQNEMESRGIGKLSFIYVDEQTINIPETQNIAISFADESIVLESATLNYQSTITGQLLTMEASEIVNNTVRFTQVYNEGPMEDAFTLIGMTYQVDGQEQKIDFISEKIDASFQVTMEAELPEAQMNNQKQPEVTAYTLDDNGSQIVQTGQSIEKTVEGVLGEAGVEKSDLSNTMLNSGMASRNKSANDFRARNIVVALAAGHDGVHKGAHKNGLAEEELTLKVAQYCKEELEQYSGVTVIQTRPTMACPYPEGNNAILDIQHEINIAKANGADLFVDIHFNTGGGTGAEVFFPNQSFNSNISQTGYEVANSILSQLEALGLANRGAKVRNCTDGEYDAAGNLADYYATNYRCKQAGIPGIIVEHAFLDRPEDAARLHDENFLRAIGIADATGIANRYGLAEKNAIPSTNKIEIIKKDEFNGTFTIKLNGVRPVSNIQSVDIQVWSDLNGAGDMKWYKAINQGNNVFMTDVKISNHNNDTGFYHADVYITDNLGEKRLTTFTIFQMQKASVTSEILAMDKMEKQYKISTKIDNTSTDISTIQYAVWSDVNGQDDIKWIDGIKESTNNWNALINIQNFNQAGKYRVHAYAKTIDGFLILLSENTFVVTQPMINLDIGTYNNTEGVFEVTVSKKNIPNNLSSVLIPVWCNTDQSDIFWYTAEKDIDGNYKAKIKISNHKYSVGKYNIHVYATTENGILAWNAGTCNVTNPKTIIKIEDKDKNEENFLMHISNMGAYGNVKNVSFAVWSELNGQDDIIWYQGNRDANGAWNSTAKVSNHKSAGEYNVHVYATLADGSLLYMGNNNFMVTQPTVAIKTSAYNVDTGTFDVTISEQNVPSGLDRVSVPVWCSSDQSDVYWYQAVKQANGTFKTTVSINNHNYAAGIYNIHIYAYGKNDVMSWNYGTCNVTTPKTNITIEDISKTEKDFQMSVTNVGVFGNVKNVSFAVWSELNGQDDIIWYQGSKDSNGAWNSTAKVSNHKLAGVYNVHVYATLADGSLRYIGNDNFMVTQPTVAIKTSAYNVDTGTFDVTISEQN
ncbi:MAG: GBS Bsp-like repeat-containing protein, partial [Lachnospiraceae bacterium]